MFVNKPIHELKYFYLKKIKNKELLVLQDQTHIYQEHSWNGEDISLKELKKIYQGLNFKRILILGFRDRGIRVLKDEVLD